MKNETIYTKQKKGHSFLKHLLFGPLVGYLNIVFAVYYVISPNHYWHM